MRPWSAAAPWATGPSARRWAHRTALLCALLGPSALPSVAAEPLRVCMAADNPPLSWLRDGQPQGLDRRLAEAAAAQLGRPLVVVPFESSYEKESTLGHEVNALLSAGVCEAVTGFPLLAGDLGRPSRASARVPDHPGAARRRERPYIPLGSLVASRAYQGAALAAVMRAPAEPWTSLAELQARPALRVGSISGTLAGALVLGWRAGALRPQMVSLSQREDLLQALQQGRIDVALLPLAQFDGWRLTHRAAADAELALGGWRRPLGLNLGVVTLAGNDSLRTAFDQVIGRALDSGELARWAAAEGASWQPPTSPDTSTGPSLAGLLNDGL